MLIAKNFSQKVSPLLIIHPPWLFLFSILPRISILQHLGFLGNVFLVRTMVHIWRCTWGARLWITDHLYQLYSWGWSLFVKIRQCEYSRSVDGVRSLLTIFIFQPMSTRPSWTGPMADFTPQFNKENHRVCVLCGSRSEVEVGIALSTILRKSDTLLCHVVSWICSICHRDPPADCKIQGAKKKYILFRNIVAVKGGVGCRFVNRHFLDCCLG